MATGDSASSSSSSSSPSPSSPIEFYSNVVGDYAVFSNFHLCRFEYAGKTWRSSEYAFQAMKFSEEGATADNLAQAERIHAAATPASAKKLGAQRRGPCALRPDWEDVKLDLMREILGEKFGQNPDLKQTLLGTGTRELREHTPRDKFWGDGGKKGGGKNMLGKILMGVREKLGEEAGRKNRWRNCSDFSVA